MPEDVIINFIGKTDELQPAENALDAIIAKEGEVGEAWRKTSDKMKSQTKEGVENTNKLAKSIDQLAVAAKSMDKVVIGGAYKDYLKQLQTQLGLTNKEVIGYLQNARKAAQEAIFSAETQEQVDELSLSIQVMNEQLQELGAQEDETGNKTQSLRTRIKEAKEQLVAMAEAGLQGTPAFIELQKYAGELDDQMRDLNATVKGLGSDTKNIDGLISAASGLAGGFAVAQGTAALFDDENEEVQKALLKVNAAMSILQGLQSIQNVLQKESAASLLLTSVFYKQNTAAITENTVATEANVVVEGQQVVASTSVAVAEGAQAAATDVATTSQIALNTAMELNPIAIVIASVVALTSALAYFALQNNEAEKQQAELNDAITKGTIIIDSNLKLLEQQTAKQIALAKSRGASELELSKIEGNAGNERLQRLNNERNAAAEIYNKAKADDKESIELKKKLYEVYFNLEQKYEDERKALEIKGIEFRKQSADEELKSFIANQEAKIKLTRSGSIAEKNAQISATKEIAAAREKSADFIALTEGEKNNLRAADARTIADTELQIYASSLKSITAAQEANISRRKIILQKNQVDTIDSINAVTSAEINAIRARVNEQLKSNPNLTSGERAKIEADASLQIIELSKQQELKLLDIKKAGINAQLILAKKGTEEEYNAKLKLIDNAQEIELSATELTQSKIDEIRTKYQIQKEETTRAINEAQLQNQINYDNALLDSFGLVETKKLDLVLSRLEKQKALEISQAEENASKIAEINARYERQIREAKIASIDTIRNAQLESLIAVSEQTIKENERIISSDKTSANQKEKAIEIIREQKKAELKIEFEALEKKVGLITDYSIQYQKLVNKLVQIDQDANDKITQNTLNALQKRTTLIQNSLNFFQKGLVNVLGDTAFTKAISSIQNFGNVANDVFSKLKVSIKQYDQVINDSSKNEEQKAEARAAKRKAEIDSYKELATVAITAAQDIINQIFSDSAAQRQQSLNETIALLEEQKNQELSTKNLTEQQKADIEKKYKEREKQEKIKAFQADKEAKKTQAVINGALAVAQAFATNPFPYSLIVAGIVAASTAIQVAKIQATPVPKFRDGKVDIQGPGTTTSDSIPAMISKGESVINADATAKWKEALTAINNGSFENYLNNKLMDFVYPTMPEYFNAPESDEGIDYEKLSTAIAQKMKGVIPAPKSTHVTIDRNGIRTFVQDGASTREYRNKKLSMN